MSNKVYEYVGKGEGIPGLPHRIDEDTAAVIRVTDILAAAIKNGSYKEVKPEKKQAPVKPKAPELKGDNHG